MINLSYKEPTSKISLSLWIATSEIAYLSRESEQVKSSIIKVNESNPFTLVCLKSGRNIMVDQTPEEIIKKIEEYHNKNLKVS